jgi:dolichol-phosphate mannosyltransferase
MTGDPYISIIIPAYNVRSSIGFVMERVVKVLKETQPNYEVICVSDGSTDDTWKIAEKEALKYAGKVKILGYKKNYGKGFAVRYGMKGAKGSVVGFIDADNEVDPRSLINLLKILKDKKADIVIGSKRNPETNIRYPMYRKIVSFLYFLLVKVLFRLPVSDTQAGVKVFTKKVIQSVLPALKIDGFSFDIEILVKAKDMGFTKIFDGPIIVDSAKSSDSSILKSFGVVKESIKMFFDTFKLFLNLRVFK